jgi:hypothetical protein
MVTAPGARRHKPRLDTFFLGGAAGSALVGPVSAAAGWSGVCLTGAIFGAAAFVVSMRSRRA